MDHEDDLGRTSKIPFLDNRASGGLRVKSSPSLYRTDASGPRVRRTAGALDTDPDGMGRGIRSLDRGRSREVRSAWPRCGHKPL
jgi:hypothetical protein